MKKNFQLLFFAVLFCLVSIPSIVLADGKAYLTSTQDSGYGTFDIATKEKMLHRDENNLLGSTCSLAFSAHNQKIYHRGCCSWHQGVCGCNGGRTVCCDGRFSPTCGC